MKKHLEREVEKLKKKLMSVCTLAEEAVFGATKAFLNRDVNTARQVITNDQEIDKLEVELEEECLKLLALHQPVAIDLRFLVAVLKINNDLERIGDLAANMATRSLRLAELKDTYDGFNLKEMANKTVVMLRNSIDALVRMEASLAHQVCLMDDEIDELNRQMYEKIYKELPGHGENAEVMILYLSVSRNLERIGDLATNIAEDVIYMIEGEIVRHRQFQDVTD